MLPELAVSCGEPGSLAWAVAVDVIKPMNVKMVMVAMLAKNRIVMVHLASREVVVVLIFCNYYKPIQ